MGTLTLWRCGKIATVRETDLPTIRKSVAAAIEGKAAPTISFCGEQKNKNYKTPGVLFVWKGELSKTQYRVTGKGNLKNLLASIDEAIAAPPDQEVNWGWRLGEVFVTNEDGSSTKVVTAGRCGTTA